MSKYPLANVHPDAKIGNDVIIEPFATVKGDVVIGDGCWIGPNAIVWEGARLGKNVKVYPGASVSSIPQDLKFAGERTETFIGDNTVIREFVTISRGTADKHKTEIGSNCLLMAYVHIAHDCTVGNNCIFANAVQVAGHVVIEDWAIIGGSSAVHQFVKVGAHVMVSGGSLVRKDIPPYTKAAREPLTYCGVNTIGLRRRGFSSEKISEIQDAYRIIFLKGLNNSKALEQVENEIALSDERNYIIDFIRSSERGVMKGFSTSAATFE
ncbi:MAG: acyl-ACP--UDP-N-acetylglucosamine O-acyltransferase [Cyclobacteriaceae bacterium]|nr:acyl-ACP--UDP-N-acetylglucosamine O-acyltransferase [Cyclobacteriaceae bacterium]MCB0498148.1 acyl-ACP--UDP-N-acetylglucosamine O-acyltransferase [Cyclobacteriaceae bacterium]MCB9238872.1 acyl-ACP--UDP-N-acetylglucosamine O-acyltransferase [Flammeovirgaceae bacterium]MCO5270591.1 acyl-ACP--UDP-N-acetylglucosamine O-acyltransferase [Cyclobacteriaceae bacterium]MCW5900968.1 acyl-ACP--UDP-N-acetylglucosamine O-acyltransferase [Cyclobacteriaceae bacterium]